MWQHQRTGMSPKKGSRKQNYNTRVYVEMQRVWNLNGVIMVEITGATGTATKGLQQNVEAIAENHSVYSLQEQLCLERNTQYGK